TKKTGHKVEVPFQGTPPDPKVNDQTKSNHDEKSQSNEDEKNKSGSKVPFGKAKVPTRGKGSSSQKTSVPPEKAKLSFPSADKRGPQGVFTSALCVVWVEIMSGCPTLWLTDLSGCVSISPCKPITGAGGTI
ncbi:hypothetical protein L7F22_011326, partial [Adiantum nelumboides]|nr:hypothetical protein [Adiantum nelumboides]